MGRAGPFAEGAQVTGHPHFFDPFIPTEGGAKSLQDAIAVSRLASPALAPVIRILRSARLRPSAEYEKDRYSRNRHGIADAAGKKWWGPPR